MSEKPIETTSAAERRRLRFKFDDADLLANRRPELLLSAPEAYEVHKRRWKLARSGAGALSNPRSLAPGR